MFHSCLSDWGGGDTRGPAAPHSVAPLRWPWWTYYKPLFLPLRCFAYDNIKLLSLAELRNKPSVLARLIKGPLEIDAVLFPEKKKVRQMNFFGFFFSDLLPVTTPKANTFLSENTVNIQPLRQFMAPYTNCPFFSFGKEILIEHLSYAGPQNTQRDERLGPTL